VREAFGDLFLEDVRAYREQRLASADKRGVFPLWGQDTSALAREFLDAAFAGREFDAALLADLPPGVDPCGENGEFHTFVHAGPIFSRPIACEAGERNIERDGFVFSDLV